MTITKAPFGAMKDGAPVELYTMKNERGMSVQVCNIGCSIVSVKVPDRAGKFIDVALGYDSAAEYEENPASFGAVTGRFAARIRGARYQWDGKTVILEKNEGNNHIHGGSHGFAYRRWGCVQSEKKLVFELNSPDGDAGFPGDLTVRVTYELTPDNTLVWESEGCTPNETICCLTNHSYFNLNGFDAGPALDHRITISADYIAETDREMLPTGKFLPVAGTPFDFTAPKTAGDDIDSSHPQMKIAGGYDHYYVLRPFAPFSARMYAPKTGIGLTICTDAPGIQFYAGNFLDGTLKAKGGYYPPKRGGLCLESIPFPDSVNHPEFPSCVVSRNHPQRYRTRLRFSVGE